MNINDFVRFRGTGTMAPEDFPEETRQLGSERVIAGLIAIAFAVGSILWMMYG